MRINRFKKIFVTAVFPVLILFGVAAAGATSARAQARRVVVRPRVFVVQRPFFGYPWWWGSPYYSSYYYDPIEYQREQGFHDGFSRGKNDARHGKPYDLNSHKHYRNSSSITYRNAFAQGYSTGYRDTRIG